MYIKPLLLLAATILTACVSSAYYFTGGPVLDIVKQPFQATQDYVLHQSILKQYNLQGATDDQKAASLDGLNQMLGAPVEQQHAALKVTNASHDPAYFAAQKELARRISTDRSPMLNYLNWAEQRRAADAAMIVHLESATKANNGKALDWNAHLKASMKFQTLSNDRLALSMAEANKAAEIRARQKAAVADALSGQLSADKRAEAEARLAAP